MEFVFFFSNTIIVCITKNYIIYNIYNDYYLYFCLEKGSSNSVFNLGEITRLMKFPGVAKTFTVKIISGLPAGEQLNYYHL